MTSLFGGKKKKNILQFKDGHYIAILCVWKADFRGFLLMTHV
jgi:hypothetical protein